MRIFVFGIGYSTEHFLKRNAAAFSSVAGTVRSAQKADRLMQEHAGWRIFAFDGADAQEPAAAAVREADAIVVSVPPAGRDVVLASFGDAIAHSAARRIVYLSTIGVYGDSGGAWIDERTPPEPREARTRARVVAEEAWLALGASAGKQVFVLRLAGIYGPDQNQLVNLRAGEARRIVKPGQVFNRIHVEDIAGAIMACLESDAGGVYNIADNEPAPPQDVIVYGASLLGVAPPPEIPFDAASLSPMAASFWSANKRVSNASARQALNWRPRYPTYREGLGAEAANLKRQGGA